MRITLPKFNDIAPEELPKPNRKGSSSNHHFQERTVKLQGVAAEKKNMTEDYFEFLVSKIPKEMPMYEVLGSVI